MSYQVLARKWRPRRFADLVGQEHVVRALVNALEHNRLHHAFLFSGTRGVGKTTIARILAKSINCESGVSAEPCGACASCRELDEGRFLDLIEVDAASRTKVDDTRELLDNVPYAPTRGRYKVYLIDEVHMLSGHSFNALLKTLEEPPAHVKFLLATTEPQKLPVTVLSRCLQFNLKRLHPGQIEAQIEKILSAEGVGYDPVSLKLLARVADGSMRDALSLLDQAIAFGGGRLAADEVRQMLGSIDQDTIARLIDALAAGEARTLLAVVREAAEHDADAGGLLDELLLALHRIALAQAAPEALADPALDRERLEQQAARLAPEDVQLYYQIGLIGRRDLALAPDPRTGLEMVLLRMLAFRPLSRPEVGGAPGRPAATPVTPVPRTAPPAAAVEAAAELAPSDWSAVVGQLKLNGLARELASRCGLQGVTDGVLQLAVDAPFAHLLNKEREALLKQALAQHYGRPVALKISVAKPRTETPAEQQAREQNHRFEAAAEAITSDPNVRALQETFNARVNPGSVRSTSKA